MELEVKYHLEDDDEDESRTVQTGGQACHEEGQGGLDGGLKLEATAKEAFQQEQRRSHADDIDFFYTTKIEL